MTAVSPDPSGITDETISRGAAAISDLLTMLGVDPDERIEHNDAPSTARQLAELVLQAGLARRAVVDLPEPDADTGKVAAWRPQQQIIEAHSDPSGIPMVRHNGSTAVAYVARETALAVVAASYRAEQFAADRSAERASGVAGGGARHD